MAPTRYQETTITSTATAFSSCCISTVSNNNRGLDWNNQPGGDGQLRNCTSTGCCSLNFHNNHDRTAVDIATAVANSVGDHHHRVWDPDFEEIQDAQRRVEGAERVKEALIRYRKRRRSPLCQVLLSCKRLLGGRSNALNLRDMGLYTLEPEAVQEMIVLQVKTLCLSHNDAMVVLPEALVQNHYYDYRRGVVDSGIRRASPPRDCCYAPIPHPLETTTTGCFVSLQHLDLSYGGLVLLSERWDLPNLLTLNLRHNRLRNFPSQAVLSGIPLLRELDLYGNKLMQLPDFADMSSFAKLSSSWPSKTATNTAPKMAYQHNSNGMVEWCPQELLMHLTVLNVGCNDLSYLPDRLPRNLKTFIASNNFLNEVPASLIQLPKNNDRMSRNGPQSAILEELQLIGNPITIPPAAVCEAGLRAMRRFFDAQDRQHLLQQQNYLSQLDSNEHSATRTREKRTRSGTRRTSSLGWWQVWKETRQCSVPPKSVLYATPQQEDYDDLYNFEDPSLSDVEDDDIRFCYRQVTRPDNIFGDPSFTTICDTAATHNSIEPLEGPPEVSCAAALTTTDGRVVLTTMDPVAVSAVAVDQRTSGGYGLNCLKSIPSFGSCGSRSTVQSPLAETVDEPSRDSRPVASTYSWRPGVNSEVPRVIEFTTTHDPDEDANI